MSKYKESGVKISNFPEATINKSTFKNRLDLNYKLMSWAPTYYGISTVNKNYQISINAIRNDMLGFIGLDNSKGNYQSYITFWKGNWFDDDRTNSYVYQWNQTDITHKDYIKNKHGLDEQYDKENRIERVFILDTAPFPLQAEDTNVNSKQNLTLGKDPNPDSKKLVNKDYVDSRHNGFRKVQKALNEQSAQENGSKLQIRPYTCFYQYSQPCAIDTNDGMPTINICDTQIMEDGRTIKDMLRHNRLTFFIRLTNHDIYHHQNGTHKCNLKLLVNGESQIVWSYEDELVEIVRENRNIRKENGETISVSTGYIFIRCEAEYINDKFTVTCSNFFGRDKKSRKITRVQFPQTPSTEQLNVDSKIIEDSTITIDLSLHEHQTFLTNIPQQNIGQQAVVKQYYINFDASGLDDYHEYTWNYYVITPNEQLQVMDNGQFKDKNYDDVIFESSSGTPIMWANSDTFNEAPTLQPNKLYCFEFTKIFDGVLLGRIKYYINLVKKT